MKHNPCIYWHLSGSLWIYLRPSQLQSISHLIIWVVLLDDARLHQQLESDIWHRADLWPYSHISVLKAITARSPCRKIPKESIRAPFAHPRSLGLGVGVEDTDVLFKETAGIPAPPPPGPASATSPCWDSMLTPLTAAMGQKSYTTPVTKVESSSTRYALV